ncbi:hypothetical protein ACN469_37315 [Corallococcus terminator]
MCWVNLCSTRYRLRASASELLSDWEQDTGLRPNSLQPVLLALIAGDASLVQRALALASRLISTYFEGFDDADLTSPAALSNIAGLSIATHLTGKDQSALWKRIAAAPVPHDTTARALQAVVARLTQPYAPPGETPRAKKHFIRSQSDWLWRLGHSPVQQTFDLSVSPDHPMWPYHLRSFVLPLGYERHRQLEAEGHTVSPMDLFQRGAYPERHAHVLYERSHPRPPTVSKPDAKDPSTWFGFDAVEADGMGLRAYHYLGFGFQAPLLFREGLDAFGFLGQLDNDWQLVREALSAEAWREVEQRREAGCTHVIVYDANEATVPKKDLARAADHFGLKLEAVDLTEV